MDTQRSPLKKILILSFGMTAVSSLIVFSSQISANVASQNLTTARQTGLEAIAKYEIAKNCWTYPATESVKINDVVPVIGTIDGRIPTSCVKVPLTAQYLQVGYKDNTLRVINVFTPIEVKNQISIEQQKGKRHD